MCSAGQRMCVSWGAAELGGDCDDFYGCAVGAQIEELYTLEFIGQECVYFGSSIQTSLTVADSTSLAVLEFAASPGCAVSVHLHQLSAEQ